MRKFVSISVVLIAALSGASIALGDTREDAAKALLQPVYPLWLAQAGLWQQDPTASQPMLDAAIQGLAKVLPENCDEARMKRDICGIKLVRVPSSSMVPSADVQETIGLQTLDYKPLQRGDVVAHTARFHGGEPTLTISRLIAFPGETVEIRGGIVLVDSVALLRKDSGEVIEHEFGPLERYTETTPEGRTYSIAIASDQSQSVVSNFGPVTLPAQKYFVLGDNRANSVDSRYPEQFNEDGFVSEESIQAVATVIFVSKQRDRIGLPLR